MNRVLLVLMARTLPALLIFTAGFYWLGCSERNLWLQAPSDALDRYAVDRVMPALPPRVDEGDLWSLCERPILSWAWGAKQALAYCLDGSGTKASHARLREMEKRWTAVINDQTNFARQVEAITPAESLPVFAQMRLLHRQLQQDSGGPILRAAEKIGLHHAAPPMAHPVADVTVREASSVSQLFSTILSKTEARLLSLQATPREENEEEYWRRVRDLGLLVTGRAIEHDNAVEASPIPLLTVDPNLLSSRLEWVRRAKPRAGAAMKATLTGFLPMMAVSAGVAIAVAAILGASPTIVAVLFLLATTGGLHLLDVAVTGSVALRHLPTRDFGEGIWNVWGWVGGMVWGPTLAFLFCLVFSVMVVRSPRLASTFDRFLRLPLILLGGMLLAGFILAMVIPIGSAVRTEILALLAALATAIFIARYSPLILHGADPKALTIYAAPLVLSVLPLSFLGNAMRLDLGALLIALMVSGIVVLILVRKWTTRLLIAVLLVSSLTAYGNFLNTGEDATGLISRLPRHGVQRFLAAEDALHHGAPDIKQVEWLIHSAERSGKINSGWGWGNVPWRGFPSNGHAQPLPLSAVSDLAFALPAGVGGVVYAFGLTAMLALILIILIQRGFNHALGSEVRLGERFLAAVGAFGLLVALLRLIINIAGTLQVLPLTGVPLVFLAHAPAAGTFALAYAALVLGACSKSTSPIKY